MLSNFFFVTAIAALATPPPALARHDLEGQPAHDRAHAGARDPAREARSRRRGRSAPQRLTRVAHQPIDIHDRGHLEARARDRPRTAAVSARRARPSRASGRRSRRRSCWSRTSGSTRSALRCRAARRASRAAGRSRGRTRTESPGSTYPISGVHRSTPERRHLTDVVLGQEVSNVWRRLR